tara:strand:+ start:19458 stop:20396 length:939 start_codon:yes stop_codon:yes gene_type:complete
MKRLTAFTLLLTSPLLYANHHPLNYDGMVELFGIDFEATEIKTDKVSHGMYVFSGVGGNLAVSIGEDGVLIVDDQFPEMIPKIQEAVRKLGGDGVDYVINTHFHFDHADGNKALGPTGTNIISHENARTDMASGRMVNLVIAKYEQGAYPKKALPQITYSDSMHVHFNEQRIDLFHFGPAHTTGDTMVYFRGSNVLHTGDVFITSGYPFIDVDNGGDIDGLIAFCEGILEQLAPDTVVIPGHGSVTNVQAIRDWVNMLSTVRGRVAKMIDEGKSLEEITAANPTKGFDESYGDPSKSLGFINRVYTSLSNKR